MSTFVCQGCRGDPKKRYFSSGDVCQGRVMGVPMENDFSTSSLKKLCQSGMIEQRLPPWHQSFSGGMMDHDNTTKSGIAQLRQQSFQSGKLFVANPAISHERWGWDARVHTDNGNAVVDAGVRISRPRPFLPLQDPFFRGLTDHAVMIARDDQCLRRELFQPFGSQGELCWRTEVRQVSADKNGINVGSGNILYNFRACGCQMNVPTVLFPRNETKSPLVQSFPPANWRRWEVRVREMSQNDGARLPLRRRFCGEIMGHGENEALSVFLPEGEARILAETS